MMSEVHSICHCNFERRSTLTIAQFCSRECRLVALASINASLDASSLKVHTECRSPPTPPVPHNSFVSLSTSPENEIEADSVDYNDPATIISLCHAELGPIYGFPPLPPRPQWSQRPSCPERPLANNFQSGVMMGSRRIQEALFPEPPKRNAFGMIDHSLPSKERKCIPGWNDGSNAWRAAVYSLSAPRDPKLLQDPNYDDRRAYKSFVASSHRSRGVYSTLDSAYQTPQASDGSPIPPPLTRNRTVDELYSKYPLAISRCFDSRSSLSSVSSTFTQAHSLPITVALIVKRKEVPLLRRGAEGKLLVPDVKLKVSTCYVSVSGSSSATTESCRSSRLMKRDSQFSDFSIESVSELVEEETTTTSSLGPPKTRRPAIETRSWSYDNLITYPIMQLPPKMEKRIEKRIIDGVEKDVEVEVEVPPPPLKRLFLFPGKEVR